MNRIHTLLISALSSLFLCACQCDTISLDSWAPDVRQALNDFIHTYGKPESGEYVVFDFDNTCCIYDVSEQFIAYQLENMCFSLDPQAFASAVRKGLEDCRDITGDRTDRAAELYASLYRRFGPFSADGVSEGTRAQLEIDGEWKEFADLMGGTYTHLIRHKAIPNPYMWAMGWFAGMDSRQLYDAFVRSDLKYAAMDTRISSWGEYEWVDGLKLTDNIRELWKALNKAGIDVWVCSASSIEAVLASIDAYGLHEWCTGAVGMTLHQDEEGRFDGGYDYETGYAYLACHNDDSCTECGKIPGWHRDNRNSGVQTKGKGKVTAIQRCIAPKYDGRGPLAGFMDSSGDFNFCTEFASLKMAVCFNRAELDVTDGGALIAETALYQRDVLGYDLARANAAGDVFYLLQGRNVNGARSLYPDNATIDYGKTEPQLFYSTRSAEMLDYFKDKQLSTAQILNTFCIRTEASDEGNPFGWDYGWLKDYDGYRSK